jgi:hypothetical protein
MPTAAFGKLSKATKGKKRGDHMFALAVFFMLLLIPTAVTQTPTLADISWIAGDWQTAPGGRRQVEEHWTQVAGRSMMGVSRTVAGEKTVEFEYLRIEQRDDGIYYVAHPKGRCPGTDFKLTRASATEAVFENPQHDFPKRIIYRKGADDSLTASIDAGEGTKAMSFPFQRVKP